MKTYARIQNDIVKELFSTSADIGTLFHPCLVWVDVTGNTAVQPGWVRQPGGSFTSPPAISAPPGAAVTIPTTASLQLQLEALQAQLVALTATSH